MNQNNVSAEFIVQYINSKVTNKIINETDVTKFERIAKEASELFYREKAGRRRGKYLRVTDLINPVHAYFDFKAPLISNPTELQSRLDYGKFIERKVAKILMEESGFVSGQGRVDGGYVEMPDVVGRIDFRMEDTLVELKTSEQDVSDVEALFSTKPQDLEQLLLYILFSGREKQDHRLLYLIDKVPNIKVKSFKVKIKNKDPVVDYFLKRRSLLLDAIEKSDPSKLGQCRYFDQLCKFKTEKICDCAGREKIDTTTIRKNVYIATSWDSWNEPIITLTENEPKVGRFWDLFQPRRWVLNELSPLEYVENDEDQSMDNYWIRKDIERKLLSDGIIEEHRVIGIPGFSGSTLLYDAQGRTKEKVPLLIRVSDNLAKYPNNYHVAQLGAVCAILSIQAGYLFNFSSKLQAGVLRKLKFDKLSEVRAAFVTQIGKMIKLPQGEELRTSLPSCPDFMIKRNCHRNCVCKDE